MFFDFFNRKKLSDLKNENLLLKSKNESLNSDVKALEEENDRLRKKYGENKKSPKIVTSKKNEQHVSSYEAGLEATEIGANLSSGISKKSSDNDIIDDALEVAGDIAEGVGEIIGSALD